MKTSHLVKWNPVGIVLALWLVIPFGLQALQFDVFVGHGNVVRELNWFPVTCEIMNDGPAFTGTIELSGTHVGNRQKRRLTLELPTNTRKRVVIPVFHGASGLASWDGFLYDQSGKLMAEQPGIRVKEVAWESVLMGVLSRTFAGAPKFPAFQDTSSTMQPEIGRIPEVEQFPDSPVLLEGLSSCYVNSEQAAQLSGTQGKALTEWIVEGGHLVLAVEQPADLVATEWLKALSPFVPETVGEVEVGSSFYRWLTSADDSKLPIPMGSGDRKIGAGRSGRVITPDSFSYRNLSRELEFESSLMPVVAGRQLDGRVLVESNGIPLVISAKRGRGTVTVLTFSPEREPFRSWKARTWFWAKLNRVPREWFDESRFNTWGGTSVDGVFGSLIESRQVRKLPVFWLLLLLVVYLLVIGPFDYWFLKRINRQMLTWITFPAYVVLFSLLIYYIGYRLRSGESEWNELHVVDVMTGGSEALLRGRTYGAIYSPSNRRYSLRCQVPGASFRGEFSGFGQSVQGVGDMLIQSHDRETEADVFVPVWTSQLYVSDWATLVAPPVIGKAERVGRDIEVEIRNTGGRAIELIAIVQDGRIHEFPGIPGGETFKQLLPERSGEQLDQYVMRMSSRYQRVLNLRNQTLGETERLEDSARHSMVASFISRAGQVGANSRGFVYPSGFELSGLSERGEAVVLLFYRDYAPIPPLNDFSVSRNRRETLLRLSLPLDGGDE